MAANGFEWVFNLGGGVPLIQSFYMKDSETFTRGDMMNIESGEVDLAVTTDVALAGTFQGPKNPNDAKDGEPGVVEGTDSTTLVMVICNPDAVYADANDTSARAAGATLDISGATGAQTVAASSNTEFVVVDRKTNSSEPTHVMIASTSHYLAKAQ